MTRRTFTIGAAGTAVMLGLGSIKLVGHDPICRPPGGQDEDAFLAACIHCERCREVCPQHAIKPARIESGVLVLRTPQMDYRSGWCDFCEGVEGGEPLCARACPTRALNPPSVASAPLSQTTVIGTAVITEAWCLAYSAMGCHECVDACPFEAMGMRSDGTPYVLADVCNGCGACEHACISLSSGSIAPNATDRAITVVAKESEAVHG